MIQTFKEFLNFGEQERQDFFEIKAEDLNTVATYVEKDFWVCFVLDILFNELPKGCPQLLFKGGTSLSKAYQLISRFSEDVDFVVFRDNSGAEKNSDPRSSEMGKNKRKKLFKELEEEASNYIRNQLKYDLELCAAAISPGCSVVLDESDKSTILFKYHSLFPQDYDTYVLPSVKLEGGVRSALDPNEQRTIKPFIADLFQGWDFSVPNIMTISPQRTFWDKVFILHGLFCRYRDQDYIHKDAR